MASLETVSLSKVASGEDKVEAMVSFLIVALSVTVRVGEDKAMSEIREAKVWMDLAVWRVEGSDIVK